ncbi:MAG TPA: UDP-N-acetylglucosamine 2-epimerase [Burkholderiales bacterium]|nr:UDP-N-acetylglucosamine 2-epimerase [Burkholderiales bacterium]
MERRAAVRRVAYVSGTRADFGLMRRTLALAQASGEIDVSVLATGMHLSRTYGCTVEDIEASGLRIAARVPARLEEGTGAEMARAIGHEIVGFTDAVAAEDPDAVLVLGDRGEMLAGAVAAMHLMKPVIHVHGGERSGTIDEPVRHAISKLAHYHFVATAGARERLVKMGERAANVFVTGAPGLDGIAESATSGRAELCAKNGFDPAKPIALVVFHPVVQEADDAGAQVRDVVEAALGRGLQCLALMPNSDAGSPAVRAVLDSYRGRDDVRLEMHLVREAYASWMAAADVMVGNSSSGIIEAASLGLPVVNVGSRQSGRERSGNVIDVPAERVAIAGGLAEALKRGRRDYVNVYGDGHASERIVKLLATLPLDVSLLAKTNAY